MVAFGNAKLCRNCENFCKIELFCFWPSQFAGFAQLWMKAFRANLRHDDYVEEEDFFEIFLRSFFTISCSWPLIKRYLQTYWHSRAIIEQMYCAHRQVHVRQEKNDGIKFFVGFTNCHFFVWVDNCCWHNGE